ncbi:folate-binding protein [Mesorhizobium sp. M1E.F.Ca.ET.045.02.1.1]|uniref:CAF17-like 4Fe-4S cluster assembly/insertion protein YgfZ n=1 Tax=Mesorhizobium sp. M1E.F.Ca.ET.045.02.1.1 TaxID=2493672 RepID=UPI000F751876|nr:folate-binding protein YgfZ [Mesorhizobium sp. M1E.F.Ca.ET.045.02.1.1]AZO24832.1 folate-binding protein [Mesorhizobium sp. M1E.F.Ca.ET.045.02.1.1]RWD81512.1 MAG: folate-binding protein [Mesorhizobium sp.]
MPFALLKDRALISVSGPDAEHFLQNILTTDLDTLAAGEAKPGALLTPQGKILFDFLISRAGDIGFRLECRADIADDFLRRLMLYRLRAKAEIAKQNQVFVTVAWDGDSNASLSDSAGADSTTLADSRFRNVAVGRVYGSAAEDGDPGAWQALRIANGIAESGSDYQLGDAFPHDVLLDETGGVGFRKGCYVGQEVVSRMQHRGTARRRVLIASADGSLPASGTELTVAGRPVGALGSVSGKTGLAIARIDRVKAALDAGEKIMAGDVAVTLAIPAWAKFTFPQDAVSAEEA